MTSRCLQCKQDLTCPRCHGTGYRQWDRARAYRWGTPTDYYLVERDLCPVCAGYKRLPTHHCVDDRWRFTGSGDLD